jgi:hypothetical protein
MAFPTVETTAETAVTTAGTNHAITLPASIAAGDLILILMDIGSTSATVNAHADYLELLDESAANGLKILYRYATGGESNPTFVTSGNTRSATIAYRISGAAHPDVWPPVIGTTGTGTSTTPDPPSVSVPNGTQDYLFIAFFGGAGEEADDDTWVNSAPTNYTNLLQKACGTAGSSLGGKIGAAQRQLNTGAAQDPGTFDQDVSTAWRSQHICIHPSVATVTVREFDGVDDAIACLGGAGTSMAAGPITYAVLFKRAETDNTPIMGGGNGHDQSGADFNNGVGVLRIEATGSGNDLYFGTNADSLPTLPVVNADNWVLGVATKASGSAAVNFHRYVLDTTTITRATGGSAINNGITPDSTLRWVFGKDEFGNRGAFRIAVAAVWSVALTNAQVDELYASLATQDWYDNSAGTPVALWDFNQADVATDVTDLTGGGADETGIVGTTVRQDALVWTYGVTVAAQSLIWQPAPSSLYSR